MWSKVRHLADGELLLMDEEGALSASRRARAVRHVAACPRCAERKAGLRSAMSEVAREYGAQPAPATPRAVARARLRARMEARPRPWWPLPELAARFAAAAAVAAVAIVAWQILDRGGLQQRAEFGTTAPTGAPAATRIGLLLPRPDLTPGVVRPIGVGDVCSGAASNGPAVESQVPRQVFAAYGVDYRYAGDYELDFLITPELGGASDARNLWPQPYRSTLWNAYVKDELELRLQVLVCEGQVDLRTAQQELAGNWIAAYKRRFGTELPLRDYDRYPLTKHDERALQSEANELRLLAFPRRVASAAARRFTPPPRFLLAPSPDRQHAAGSHWTPGRS